MKKLYFLLYRLAHVVLTINCEGALYAKVMKAFLGALSRSFVDIKKKDALLKLIANCWTRNLKLWLDYSVLDFLE